MGIINPNLRPDLDALRVDVAVAALRDIIKDGWSVLALSAGMADGFVDSTGIASLGGAAYDSTNKLIKNSVAPFQPASGSMAAMGGNNTVIMNGQGALTNGATVTALGLCFTSADTVIPKIVRYNSSGNYDVIATYGNQSHAGGGWQWFTLATPYTVPASGTYYVAFHVNSTTTTGLPSTNDAFKAGDVGVSSGVSFTEEVGTRSLAMGAQYGQVAVSTVSAAFALGAQPSLVRVVAPVELGGGAIGTDCLLDVSRDGANWANVALSDLGKFDANTRIVGGLSSVAGQPAGSSLYWRWRTTATYALKLHGIWLQAK